MIDYLRYLDENIMPYADFLHTPKSFPLTRYATKSYLGISFSFLMILILIIVSIKEILSFKRKTSLIYSQNFIQKMEWEDKIITLGFNVSEEWRNEVYFEMIDSNNTNVELKTCNEDLIETPNGVYHCIIDYPLKINYNCEHTLKIYLRLKNKYIAYTKDVDIPFTLAMKEPVINPDNYNNILDLKYSTIQRYRSFFNTKEITSNRRYLKLIRYITKDIKYIFGDDFREMDAIYIDDFEDSIELPVSQIIEQDSSIFGTYRIMVSKKIDIYERDYDYLQLLSKIGGYIGTLKSIFKLLCIIFVNPNDYFRIVDYLRKKESINFDTDLKIIYDESNNKNKVDSSEFNDIIMSDKSWKKFCYFFRCFNPSSKRAKTLSVVSQYIKKNLTIENYLETQILTKEFLKNSKKIDELKAKYLSQYKRKDLEKLITLENILTDMDIDNNKNPNPLRNSLEMYSLESKSINSEEAQEIGENTEDKDNNNTNISSFNEKEKEKI